MFGEIPRCRRERFTLDLNDLVQPRAMYEPAGSAFALMITEGLLLFLPATTVEPRPPKPATKAPSGTG